MIYMDNAATTIKKPKVVAKKVFEAIDSEIFANPSRGGHEASILALDAVYTARENIAKLFNANALNISFTHNATYALNMAIDSLITQSDDVISTKYEHNSALRPLYKKAAKGTKLQFIDILDDFTLDWENAKKLITKNTKFLVINLASNITGEVMDFEKIRDFCNEFDLIMIADASQIAGAKRADYSILPKGIICFTGHKSLYGPQGTGGMVISDNLNLKPVIVGGSGFKSFSHEHPKNLPDIFEAGTLNVHGICGLNAACEYILENEDYIYKRLFNLSKRFYLGLKKIPNIKIYSSGNIINNTATFSINLNNLDSAEFELKLEEEYGIAIRSGSHCAPLVHERFNTVEKGMARFSFSSFNTFEEIDIALNAIDIIANKK
ncbi:MAG: aminotransferase class V-fold PLP-dependent enzyme [Tissierellia bacterium]|nr:aminotransferase class V-fold PLP-dependent enzyme [Tissierellia bacterium]